MEAIRPYLYAALFLFCVFLLIRLTIFICNKAAQRKILKFGRAAEDTVGALLISMFGARYILTNLYLPYRTKNGTAYTELDCIVVSTQGILSIEVKSLVGTITNPNAKTWHQSRADEGREKEMDFINPIWQNERHVKALIGIMEKARLRNKPKVTSMVVFTSNHAKFVYHKQPEIYSLPEAIRFLKEQGQSRTFSERERKKIVRAIKKSSMPKHKALRHNRKLRHDSV